eukprot:COSAG06_NODE_853_length_11950_cov_3.644249_5_plen_47_part_00
MCGARAIAAAVSGRAGTVVWQMAMEGGLSRQCADDTVLVPTHCKGE